MIIVSAEVPDSIKDLGGCRGRTITCIVFNDLNIDTDRRVGCVIIKFFSHKGGNFTNFNVGFHCPENVMSSIIYFFSFGIKGGLGKV